MLEFPGFAKRIQEIQERHSAAIDLSERMFTTWVNLPILDRLRESELSEEILSLSYMLNFQACRQLRSVIQLCKIGEGTNANILSRCLFETTLAAHFILAEEFFIVAEPELGKPYGCPPKRDVLDNKWIARPRRDCEACEPLSRGERAVLYQTHCMAQGCKIAKGISERELAATGEGLPLDTESLEAARKRIGPKWACIQRQSRTYSGLSVKELAKAAGDPFNMWYEHVYPDQCRDVHGVNPISNVEIDHEAQDVVPRWFSPDNVIAEVVYYGNMLFMTFSCTLHNNIGLGDDIDKELEAYFEELKVVYNYQPPKN